jgi:uncharacterized protein YjbI with pentapeptide repeats
MADTIIKGANFSSTSNYFTQALLYSTASYKNKDLSGVNFGYNKLSGFDLSGQNLTGAGFYSADLSGVNMTDAVVAGADFSSAFSFTRDLLYSTASYKNKDLRGVSFRYNNFSGFDLSGQDLRNTMFLSCSFSGTDFSFADMRTTKYGDYISTPNMNNTIRSDGQIQGLNIASGKTLVIRNFEIGITVVGTMTMAADSRLQFILDGNPWGSTITIASGVNPLLNGDIELLFADGVDINALIGTTYKLFNWNGQLLEGQEFADIITQPGLAWDVSHVYTTGEITLVPEPASAMLMMLGAAWMAARRKR